MAFTIPAHDSGVTCEVADDANPKRKPLTVHVTQVGYGVCVAVRNDAGQEMCSVQLDYHGNKIGVVAYKPESDDAPDLNFRLVSDVRAERAKTYPEDADGRDDGGGADEQHG